MMKKSKKLWAHPLGYKESFLIAFELLLVGFLIEIITPGISLPEITMPVNIIIGLVLLGIIISLKIYFGNRPFVQWLSSIPAAISAIALLAFLSMLLGFLPSQAMANNSFASRMGLSHLKVSWPFLLSQLYFLLTLGMVTLKRLIPFKKKNVGFLLNHLGLWILLFAALLGSGDLKRLSIQLHEDKEFVEVAQDRSNRFFKLPFAVKLNDFHIEQYKPKIAILSNPRLTLAEDIPNNLVMLTDSAEMVLGDFKIALVSYYENSIFAGGQYIERDTFGAAPAALVQVVNKKQGINKQGWISPGNFAHRSAILKLSDKYSIGLTTPEPKVYSSDLIIQHAGNQIDSVEIIVNKPYKTGRWKLYQTGYDSTRGKYSKISILEAVYDPWLPVVYFGIFMLLAGAVYLFWKGRDEIPTDKNNLD